MKRTSLIAVLTAGALMLAGCGSGATKTAKKLAKTEVVKTADAGKKNDKTAKGSITLADISAYLEIMSQQYGVTDDNYESFVSFMAESIESTYKNAELAKILGIEYTEEDKESALMTRASMASSVGGYSKFEEYLEKAGSSIEFIDNYCKAELYSQKLLSDEKYTAAIDEITIDEAAIKEKFGKYYYAKHILIPENAPEDTVTDEAAAEETAAEAATEEAAAEAAAENAAYGEEFANQLLERAKNGEDFDAMMKEYSTDPGLETSPNGYVFKEGDMVKEFEDCVKGLKPGEFGICKTSHGYHIIERLELNESNPNYNEFFEDNKSAIEDELKTEELYKKHNVKTSVNKDAIKGLKMDQLPKFEESAE